jgi:hypothetical protein
MVIMTHMVGAYDIDGFDNTAGTVSTLHARGIKAICYMDAGTWEDWRPDAGQFPSSVLGAANGWPGERWLDIRRQSILDPIMEHRAQICKAKGFDAIEWDNVDGYTTTTGFPLSYQDQLGYNRFLAGYTHALGMSVALKNDLDQIGDLRPSFDFSVDEQCFEHSECALLAPFIAENKAVFEVEYTGNPAQFCPTARSMKLSAAKASINLDGSLWIPC